MSLFQAVVLGLVQGLSEFLPVSSSAHLSLVPWMFGWRDPGLPFDVALHLGTLAAVLWYFRAEWWALILAARDLVLHRDLRSPEQRRVLYLVLATIPGALGGLVLHDYAETIFRAPALTAAALILMGVILWAADRWSPQARPLREMRWTDALAMGLAQVFALVPGVSRSGATMTAGRTLRLDRQSAAVFSFLMSMPITAAAAILEVPDAAREAGDLTPLIVGVLAAGLSGWLAIAVLLRYVGRHSFGIFALYRVLLGLAVFAVIYARA